MKKICVVLCIAFPLYGYSQRLLSGTVTDAATHEPLIGVSLYISDLKTGAVTDSSGNYVIRNLPSGKFILEATYPSYKSKAVPFVLEESTHLPIEMEQTIAEFKEFVVTGAGKVTELRKSPLSMATIHLNEITQGVHSNIIEALTAIPGVNAVSTGPNISKPVIRGLGSNRMLTLYNGMRQEGQQWGDEHGIEVDEYAIDHAEIIKGPASLTYGSDAMAGVVNLISPPPATEGKISGVVLTNYQSNNGLSGLSVNLAGRKSGFTWGGRVSHKLASNYRNSADGRVYNTSFSEYDMSGYTGFNGKHGYSQLHFTLYDNTQGVPDGSRDSTSRRFTRQISEADTLREIVPDKDLNSYDIPVLHQHIQHYRAYLSNHLMLNKSSLGFNIGYQRSIRREFSHPEYITTPGLYMDLNTITYDLKFHIPEFRNYETTLGMNGMYQVNSNHGTAFIIPDYAQLDVGVFAFARKSIDQFDISGGMRCDYRFYTNEAVYLKSDPNTSFEVKVNDPAGARLAFESKSLSFSGLSGSLGMSYNPNSHLTFKFNIGRGYRAPNVSEISSNGVHPGTQIFQIGNSHFKPELSLQEDLGVIFTGRHISGSLEVFYNHISDYITNEKLRASNGMDSLDQQGNQFFQYRQVVAQLYGGEGSLDIHPHPFDWLHLENTISVVYGMNTGASNDSSTYLSTIPPFQWRSDIRTDFRKVSANLRAIYLKVGMHYSGPQNRVMLANNTETPTPSYTLINAGIGGNVTNHKGATLFSLHLLCANIFDVAYQSHMSRLKYMDSYPVNYTGRSGIFNMGRNLSIKLLIPF